MWAWTLSTVLCTAALAAAADEATPAEAVSPAELGELLEQSETAARSGDPAFAAHVDAVLEAIPGLNQTVSPALAARVHRVVGIRAFSEQGVGAALPSFLAARRLEPDQALLPGVELQGTELGTAYQSIDPSRAVVQPLSVPAELQAWVDGRPTPERVQDAPAVVQLTRAQALVASHYLAPGAPLPLPPASPEPPRARRAWAWTAGGLGIAAAALAGGAAAVHARFDALPSGPASAAEASRLQSTNQGLAIGALASLGLAVGAGAVALVPVGT